MDVQIYWIWAAILNKFDFIQLNITKVDITYHEYI